MPFVNVTQTFQAYIGNITFFTAGPDQTTFCPSTITLAATVVGDLTGHTVRWEEVLTYNYIDANPTTQKLIVPGNVTSTFYSSRETVEIFNTNNGVGIGNYIITNAFYNGVNTELTVSPSTPLPPFMGKAGVFRHAGSSSSPGTVWITSQNLIVVQYTPVGGNDARFRFWLDRGTLYQQYDDLDVFLTPGHIFDTNRNGTNYSFNPIFFAACRIPPYTLLPASTYGPCGDGAENIVTSWLLQWGDPTCDSSKVEEYIIQESSDGGNTWSTLTTSPIPTMVPVTTGTIVRIVTAYREPGVVKPLTYTGPYNSILDSIYSVSPPIYVIQYITPTNNELYVRDSYCMYTHGTNSIFDPIFNYLFTPLTALFVDPTTFPELEHITQRTYGGAVSQDPIFNYTVSGSVVIGG